MPYDFTAGGAFGRRLQDAYRSGFVSKDTVVRALDETVLADGVVSDEEREQVYRSKAHFGDPSDWHNTAPEAHDFLRAFSLQNHIKLDGWERGEIYYRLDSRQHGTPTSKPTGEHWDFAMKYGAAFHVYDGILYSEHSYTDYLGEMRSDWSRIGPTPIPRDMIGD
jgi:hypothetical protein